MTKLNINLHGSYGHGKQNINNISLKVYEINLLTNLAPFFLPKGRA